MDLSGEYIFDAPVDLTWEALRDPDVLGSVLPGGEGIQEIGENEYEGNLKIKVGPVQGKFKGHIQLSELVPPESYTIAVDGKGAPGFVKGGGSIKLTDQGEKTHMSYSGSAKVGGRIASVGQRLLDASAKSIVKQSLDALNAYLLVEATKKSAADSAAAEATEAAAKAGADEAAAKEAAEVAAAEAAAKVDVPEYVPPSQTELATNVAKDVAKDNMGMVIGGIAVVVAIIALIAFIL